MLGVLLMACGGDDGATEGGSSSTGGDSGSSSDTGAAPAPVGAPCDHQGDLDFSGGFHLSNDDDCAGGICSYVMWPNSNVCGSDADCGDYPEPGAYVCVAGQCAYSEGYRLKRSMCAQTCEVDQDCLPVDLSTECQTGIGCVIASPDCCEKLCLCLDDLSEGGIMEATAACAADPNPDCPR